MSSSHLIRLGPSQWHIWRLSAVRSTGFDVGLVDRMADGALMEAVSADKNTAAEYQRVYAQAFAREAARLVALIKNEAYREAVIWQSPHLLDNCMDKIVALEPGEVPDAKQRRRMLIAASYLQRYAVKNDSIGFFGPIGWAIWTENPQALTVSPGARLLRRRNVYFESWAIEALGEKFARDQDLLLELRPHLAPQYVMDEDELVTPLGKKVHLTDVERRLVGQANGCCHVREMVDRVGGTAGITPADVLAAVKSLLRERILLSGLEVPVSAEPEVLLRERLQELPSSEARSRSLHLLEELVSLRSEVNAGAGDSRRLQTAIGRLGERFASLTGIPASRRAGENQAGRTILYEDTVRNVKIEIGRPLAEVLGPPLELLLESARWFAATAADKYRQRLIEIFEKLRARTRCETIPLALLYGMATPDLVFSFREPPEIVAAVVDEFQRRWSRILDIPVTAREHRVESSAIRDAVYEEFSSEGPQWSAAVHHSLDIMLAAENPDAVNRGEFLSVLGELHVATNTMEARPFVEQADDPASLLEADERDHGVRRIMVVPSKESTQVNSRTFPSALLSPQYTYWTLHADMAMHPGMAIPAAALRVCRKGDDLIVENTLDKRQFDVIEVLGELLSGAVMNSFLLVGLGGHQPRVVIDQMVVARESWTIDSGHIEWVNCEQTSERYRQAWTWRQEKSIPRQCFYRVPVEDKPIFVDFGSALLVEILARSIRRTMRSAGSQSIVFTEFFPDFDQVWLRDSAGRRYTSEMRVVAVDPRGS